MSAWHHEKLAVVRKSLCQRIKKPCSEIFVLLRYPRKRHVSGNEHEVRRRVFPPTNFFDDLVIHGDPMISLLIALVHVGQMKPPDQHTTHHQRLIFAPLAAS